MGTFSDLVLGANDATLTPAQAPKPFSFSDEILGGGQPVAPPAPAEEPDNRSLFRKGVDLVQGRQDPAYQGLKSFDEEMGAEKNTDAIRKLRMGAMVAGDDARYGDIMKDSLGERFLRKETDKFGHDVVVYKGADGAEKKAYVNKPGLDTEDVSRGLVQAVPYAIGGGGAAAVTKGLPWLLRAGAQAIAGAGTSAATDLTSTALGSEQGVDPGKAVVIGGLGVAGEAASPLINAMWRRFVTVPGLFNRATGELTDKGAKAAEAAGIDPTALKGKIGEEFAKIYAKSPRAAASDIGEQSASTAFNIPSSKGQRTKDAEQLLQEKGMRYGLQGQNAKEIMQEFDKRQAEAVKSAAIGTVEPIPGAKIAAEEVKPGLGTSFAPHRTPDQLNPATLGESIKGGLQGSKEAAREAETEAWKGVTDLVPKQEAFELLPQALAGKIGRTRFDEKLTPGAWSMANDLQNWVDGKAMVSNAPKILQQTPVRTVDEMRRRLLDTYMDTAELGDKRAAKALYDGFNDWIGQAAEKQLLAGNPEAAAALRVARGVSRDIKGIFSPTDKAGRQTAGARILEEVMEKADSPERMVSALFFNNPQPTQIKAGSIEALQRIKQALTTHGDQTVGKATWDDIRAAYWMRLVQDKKGDVFTPGVMLNNIKTSIASQRTVLQQLYSREELARIGQFVKALEQITYKDPNPSGSGVAAATFAKQFFGKIFDALGGNSRVVQTGLELSGLNRAHGTAAARAATSQSVRPANSSFGPPFAATGAQVYGNSE